MDYICLDEEAVLYTVYCVQYTLYTVTSRRGRARHRGATLSQTWPAAEIAITFLKDVLFLSKRVQNMRDSVNPLLGKAALSNTGT